MTAEPGEDTTDDEIEGDHVFCPLCDGAFSPLLDACPDDGARLIRLRRDPMLGRVLDGRFEIVGPLGQGGMGIVYRGVQRSVDREVAIKVIRGELAADRASAKRFLREAKLLTSVSHPNLVAVYDFGQTDDGALYLAMELLRGKTLADVLTARGRCSPEETCNITYQLCDAIAAAHAKGIIHRDLKPGNIIVLDNGPTRDFIKVLDFGIAKSLAADHSTTLTQAGAIMGTPQYMAPESISGFADERTDLYAVGCIMYELLTGAPVFVDGTLEAILARHVAETPAPLPATIPAPLRSLVAALLAKDPARRPASAIAVRAPLAALLELQPLDATAGSAVTMPAVAAEPNAPTVKQRPVPRSRRPIVIVLVLAVIVVAGGAIAGFSSHGSSTPPDVAAPPVVTPTQIDAAPIQLATPDASVVSDAGVTDLPPHDAPPPDARTRHPHPRTGSGSGSGDPDIDFVH